MKKKLAIILTLVLLLTLLKGFSTNNVHAESSYGARAEFGGENGTELFLGGKYIELGISNWGDFGTKGGKPANFRGTDARDNLGMSADHDGFGIGHDLPIDYYLPGTEEERFAVGYKVGETSYAKSNSSIMESYDMSTVVTNESDLSNGNLKAKIVSTWTDKMEITQTVSFNENDKYYRNDVTIKNISDSHFDSARYMRSMDPDNTVDQGGPYVTANTVKYTYAEDGFSVVQAETNSDTDPLFLAFGSRVPIFFFSSDPAAKASVFGFTNTNPYASAAYASPAAKGNRIVSDVGITITWDSGPLAHNESKTFTYFTSLDERPFEEVLLEIEPSNSIQETEANDGTVAGKQRVLIKGSKLVTSIDPTLIKLNNLPDGISYTVKRVSDTLLEFIFSGASLNHGSEYSINNASITIPKELIVDGRNDYTTEPFAVKFIDPAHAYIDQATVTSDVYGVFDNTNYVAVKILNSKFTKNVSNADISIDNLLHGLSYNVVRISDTEIRLEISGTVASAFDVDNASVTIAANALIGSSLALTTNTFKIDSGLQKPTLVVGTPVLYESSVTGVISGELVINLMNGAFAEPVVTGAVYGINLPNGITVGGVERISDTQLKVLFGGQAVDSNAIDSVTNAQIAVDKSTIIATNDYVLADNVLTNTFALFFYDNFVELRVIESTIHDNLDATVSNTLTVELIKGTFTSDITGGVKVNNLPEGLDFTVDRISDTLLTITFTGAASKYNPASAFASVSVAESIVDGADSVVTSNSFDLRAPSHLTLVTWDNDLLTWDLIKSANSNQDNVLSKLDLFKVGENNTKISWTSSHPTVISTTGTVVRPSKFSPDVEVVLTASISHGDVTQTKSFTVIVKRQPTVLLLTNVVIEDSNPNVATLTFNQELSRTLTIDDFAGLTIAGKSITDVLINGDTATITLSEGVVPLESLVVTYDENNGALMGTTGPGSELLTILESNQTGITKTNNVSYLKVISVNVEDNKAGEAVVAFNKELVPTLTKADFAGFTIAGKTVTGVVIDGKTARVTFSEPIAPSDALTVIYNPSTGNITTTVGAIKELVLISESDQAGITSANTVIQLEMIAGFVKGGKLKLVFNKEIDEASLKLDGLKYGGLAVRSPYVVIGNELIVTLPGQPNDELLTFETGKIHTKNNVNNALEFIISGIDFGASQSFISTKGKLTNNTLNLLNEDKDLVIAPAFNYEQASGYNVFVPNQVKSIQLDSIPAHQVGTLVKVTIDGKEIDVTNNEELPLKVGSNVLKISVYDALNSNVLLGQYEILINRANPILGPSTDSNSTVVEVDIVIGGDQQKDITKIEIIRTTKPDGSISDLVSYTPDKALEVVTKAKQSGSSIARIVIPDPTDKVSEVNVNIPLESAKMLQQNGIDLEIYTENATIRLPQSSLVGLVEDFYFRVVPVKDEDERQSIEDRTRVEEVVRRVAGNNNIEVVARPMTIETNLPSRLVELVLPLKNVEIPTDAAEREVFLAQLAIFIEHSDGEKKVVIPEVVTSFDGTLGLKFTIKKFSTFTIFNFNNAKLGHHIAYINGFPDGEFKPEYSATRGQIALMMARNLGFDEKTVINDKSFEDVAVSHYAAAAIAFVNQAGIMVGDPDGKFRADDMVKRAEMASLVKNYLGLKTSVNNELSFSDTKGHWAQFIIEANVEAGILSGYPDGSFKPNTNLTRAEAVTIINQIFDRGPLNGLSEFSFPDVSTTHWAFKDIEEASINHGYLHDEQNNELFISKE